MCAECGAHYERLKGKPLLIDFERSIVTRDAVFTNSPEEEVGNASRIGVFLQHLAYGASSKMMPCFLQTLEERLQQVDDQVLRILLIGGGTRGPGEDILDAEPCYRVLRTDIYLGHDVDIICDAHALPFRDDTFDAILCQAVLEHVLDPQRVVNEMHRVLRANGIVAAGTPFLQGVHMDAYDFTRCTLNGHRWWFRRFDEVASGVRGGPGLSVIWSLGILARGLGMGQKLAAIFTAFFSWLRWLDRFVSDKYLEDGANGVCFVGTKRMECMKPHEMVTYYKERRSRFAKKH